jgi:arylsulfatase A-like enzyme
MVGEPVDPAPRPAQPAARVVTRATKALPVAPFRLPTAQPIKEKTVARPGHKDDALSRSQAARREWMAMCLALALVLLAIKVRLLPCDVATIGEFARWLARLAVVSADDVLLVGIFAAVCGLVSWLVCRWTVACRAWRAVQFVIFFTLAAYAVLAMALFRVTLQPFNIRMLTLVEGPMTMLDSIKPYLTWYWLSALFLTPPAVLAAPWVLRRFWWFRSGAPLRTAGVAAALGLLAAYVLASHYYVGTRWTDPRRWERRIACNPHLALAYSCLEEFCLKDESWTLVYHGEANEQDFVTRRRPGDQPAVNLEGFAPTPRPKNVVVLLLESVAAEYLPIYGSQHPTTPHLEKLVAEPGAVVFDNFYVTAPYSCKSMVALSASVYERLDWKLVVQHSPEFRIPTVTEVLREHGYRTCYAHSGYWSWRNRDRFLKDRVGDLIDADQIPGPRTSSWGKTDKAMFQATLDWIDADPQTPFFLLAFTIETHHPYATPAEPIAFDVEDKELHSYLNAIRATDEYVAWFLNELEQRKLLDDTLVIITGDNGEAFGQHNQRTHNFGIYDCNVHLPLVMLHPSLKDMPRRARGPREQIDLAPTVLDFLGIKSPGVWQGRNLFRPDDGRPAYFYCVGNYVVLGLRDGAYKYHYYVDSGLEELFNLEVDPKESKNIAAKHPDRCDDYRKRVGGLARYQRRFLAEHGSP